MSEKIDKRLVGPIYKAHMWEYIFLSCKKRHLEHPSARKYPLNKEGGYFLLNVASVEFLVKFIMFGYG